MDKIKDIKTKVKDKFVKFIDRVRNTDRKELVNKIKKQKFILGVIVASIILLILTFWYSITSKTKLLEDMSTALKNNETSKISKYIDFDGGSLSSKDIDSLMEYYQNNTSRINETIEKLRSTDKSDFFAVQKKKKFFWDDYYLKLNSIQVKVKTNIENAKVYLDNKLMQSDTEKDVVPGIHKVKAVLETPYGVVEKEEQVSLIKNEDISLTLDAFKITISSNVDDAEVYINGKSIGKKVKDVKDFGPVPMNSDVSISLEKEFPWGIIKSEEVKVKDVPNINVQINLVNDTLIENIKKVSQDFYKSVFEALNSRNSDLILFADKDTKGKIYSEIEKKEVFFKNNYQINDFTTEIESSEFRIEDNFYKAKVVIKVNYNVYKKLLPFLKEPHEDMFLTSMKYVGNEWIVEDVQKFNLE